MLHLDFSALLSALEQWRDAMTAPEIYLQLLQVVACVAVAVALGGLVRRYTPNTLPVTTAMLPFVKGLGQLSAPFFALLLLSIAKAHTARYISNPAILILASELALAWLAARFVALAVPNPVLSRVLSYGILILTLLATTGLLHATAQYMDSLAFTIGKLRLSVLGVLNGGVLLALLLWLSTATVRGTEHYLRGLDSIHDSTRELIAKFLRILLYFLAVVIALNAVGIDLTALAVFGGALGVGIGFGLQKITANFISGIILLFDKSVKAGDLVQLGNDSGFVRQIAVRYTLVETFDGREVMIPNEEMVATRLTNWTYSSPRARVDVEVSISYRCDPELAQKLMLEAAAESSHVTHDPAPSCFLKLFGENGLGFILMFWIEDVSQGRHAARSDVMFRVLEKFHANGIEIPFPQREVAVRQV